MEDGYSRQVGGRKGRTCVFRVPATLSDAAVSACAERGCNMSDLARVGLDALGRAEVDTEFFGEAARCVDDAGKLLNAAAYRMNSCARRFGDVSCQSARDLEVFNQLVAGSCEASRAAASTLSPLRRAGAMAGSAGVVMTGEGDRSMSAESANLTEYLGVRLSPDERARLRDAGRPTSATLRLALAVAIAWQGEGLLLVLTPSALATLNTAILRWCVNVEQVHVAASALREAQSTSRYLSALDAAACRRLLTQAVSQADTALSSLDLALGPLAVATETVCRERGAVLARVEKGGE